MQFTFKTLNNVQTQLIIWDNPFESKGSDVIVVVAGNPGIPDFYIEFGQTLHERTGLPVCVVGDAGHVEVPDPDSNTLSIYKEHLFGLQAQQDHKADLILNYIDKNSQLHLVGHSIGCWLLLELLDEHDSIIPRISSINFLFPTIQRFNETKNVKVLKLLLGGLYRKLHFLFILFIYVVYLLMPDFIREYLIGVYMKLNSLPCNYKERINKLIRPPVLEKVLFLTYDEKEKIKDLNYRAIEKIKDRTSIIHGSQDGWAPPSYMEVLKQFQPPLQMKLVDIDHCFVMKYSEEVAEMVAFNIMKKFKST